MARLYQAIADVTGATWIVDSSKLGSDAVLLPGTPGLAPTALHLTRDPRAVAFSWSRGSAESRDHPAYIPRQSTSRSGLDWLWMNISAEIALTAFDEQSVIRLRYEDLVASPARELSRILHKLGLPALMEAADGNPISFTETHLLGGNPVRFKQTLSIRPDHEWIHSMSSARKLMVGGATWPLLAKYGYRLRAPGDSR